MAWPRLQSYLKKGSISEYRKGFIYIFSSKILIIGLGFLVTPILSRLYTPAEYGFFGLMSGVGMVLVLISNITLPQSLLTVKEEKIKETYLAIIDFALVINLGFVLLSGVAIVFLNDSLSTSLPFDMLSVSLIALSSFMVTLTQILANLNIRNKAFGKNVLVSITESVTLRFMSLVFGFIGFTKFGLFIADLSGKISNLFLQVRFKEWQINIYSNQKIFSVHRLIRVFRENRSYPYFNLPSSLIAGFFNQTVLWILAISFSSASVGHFTMAISLLNMPLVLLASSLQPLITSKLITENDTFSKRHFIKMIVLISLISFCTYVFIYALSPYFVEIYLGDNWIEVIDLVKILCIPFSLQLLGNSIQGTFIVYNKQRSNLIIKIFFFIILIFAISSKWVTGEGLHALVMVYAVLVSVEELIKILYLTLRIKYV